MPGTDDGVGIELRKMDFTLNNYRVSSSPGDTHRARSRDRSSERFSDSRLGTYYAVLSLSFSREFNRTLETRSSPLTRVNTAGKRAILTGRHKTVREKQFRRREELCELSQRNLDGSIGREGFEINLKRIGGLFN